MATVKLDPAKGVQIPNLTTTERNAISSPETGALIWNTTTSAINQYNGSAWEATDTNTQADITGKLNLSGGAMTGTITGFTSTGIDDNATSTAITIDAAENVGIGITPKSWYSTVTALQIAPTGALYNSSNWEDFSIGCNSYYNSGGTESYIQTDAACKIRLTDSGLMDFKVAASGSADAAITWTTAMTIDNSGRVTMPLQPSFLANGSPSKDGSNFIHSFANIKYNIGSHYVNSNGRFTAPVAGRYLFIAGIFAQASTDNMLAILINGSGDYAGAHVFNESGQTSTGNISVVLNLAVNDYVSVACDYNVQGSTPRNFFSGILIG